MNQTFIGVSFKAGNRKYTFQFPYNMSETQWSNITPTEYEILVGHIGEQINMYKRDNRIIEPTELKSMEFTPHFPVID